MTEPSVTLINEFIDAVVLNRSRAELMLAADPELIRARGLHQGTALHFLAIEGYAEGVQFLAEHGADVNALNEFGDPPLIDVATLGNDAIAEILLRWGADPNACSPTRDNALHCAVRSGNARLVAILLEAGADPHYTTDIEETVLDALPDGPAEREAVLAVLTPHGIERPGGTL
ncbi:MAG: ankyrin repeat domain-containing protein [Planctomycetaceae bacterium]